MLVIATRISFQPLLLSTPVPHLLLKGLATYAGRYLIDLWLADFSHPMGI